MNCQPPPPADPYGVKTIPSFKCLLFFKGVALQCVVHVCSWLKWFFRRRDSLSLLCVTLWFSLHICQKSTSGFCVVGEIRCTLAQSALRFVCFLKTEQERCGTPEAKLFFLRSSETRLVVATAESLLCAGDQVVQACCTLGAAPLSINLACLSHRFDQGGALFLQSGL